MAKKEVEYVIRIGTFDRYRHLHVKESGKILYFRVQYETKFNNIWYPVVRYDTAHGFAHRDFINLNGIKTKTPMFTSDYNEALTFAESDIRSN